MALEANEVDIPAPRMLPNTNILCPFYLIGDGGFPLRNYLLKPYVRTRMMSVEQRIFNIRLSHARKIIECAFGVLCKRWRIFECALDFNLTTSESVIMSIICLHNFVITEELTLPNNARMYYSGNEETDDSDDSHDSDDSDDSDDSEGSHNSDETEGHDSGISDAHVDDSSFNRVMNVDNENIDTDISDNNNMDDSSTSSSDSNVSDADDEGVEHQEIRRILENYFVSPAGNVQWQWTKLR